MNARERITLMLGTDYYGRRTFSLDGNWSIDDQLSLIKDLVSLPFWVSFSLAGDQFIWNDPLASTSIHSGSTLILRSVVVPAFSGTLVLRELFLDAGVDQAEWIEFDPLDLFSPMEVQQGVPTIVLISISLFEVCPIYQECI